MLQPRWRHAHQQHEQVDGPVASVSDGRRIERIRHYLAGDLKPGLTVAEAGERYCALASPELYHSLTVELGWTAERHQRWLTDLTRTDLLR